LQPVHERRPGESPNTLDHYLLTVHEHGVDLTTPQGRHRRFPIVE
jgi:hypothetical protein